MVFTLRATFMALETFLYVLLRKPSFFAVVNTNFFSYVTIIKMSLAIFKAFSLVNRHVLYVVVPCGAVHKTSRVENMEIWVLAL